MRALLILAGIGIVGFCGGCAPQDAQCTAQPDVNGKALFSKWTSSDCSETVTLAANKITVTKQEAVCVCNASVCGTTTSGSYLFQDCTYTGGGSGDPGCSALDGHGGPYTNAAGKLTVCKFDCTDYY